MTRPCRTIITIWATIFSLYHIYTFIADRVRISQEREEQCAGYSREDRKPCLIVRFATEHEG